MDWPVQMPYPWARKVVICPINTRGGMSGLGINKAIKDHVRSWTEEWTSKSSTFIRSDVSSILYCASCTFAMISFLLDLALSVTFNLHKTFFSKRKVMLSGGPSRGISSQPSSETDSLKRIALSEFYWFAVNCTRKASDLFRWVPSDSREIDKKNECHRFYILHLEIS